MFFTNICRIELNILCLVYLCLRDLPSLEVGGSRKFGKEPRGPECSGLGGEAGRDAGQLHQLQPHSSMERGPQQPWL